MANGPIDVSRLSPAEHRVLAAALQGGSVREIAAELFLADATVKTHLAHIYDKLGLHGRLELLAHFGAVRDARPPVASSAQGSSVPSTKRQTRMPHRTLAVLLGVGLLVGVAMAFGSQFQPGSNPADLERLAAAEEIQSLRLDGSTLWITTQWSSEMVVHGVAPERVRELAVTHAIPLSVSSASADETTLSGAPGLLLGILIVLAAGFVVAVGRRIRRGSPLGAA
ncbi:MAG: helix-turn-helix transcriptional regulator [Chloroflexota bacterium]